MSNLLIEHNSDLPYEEYLHRNEDNLRIEYLPVGSPEFNTTEECWKHGKYDLSSNYYPSFQSLRHVVSLYYRTKRDNFIKKYLLRSTN